MSSIPQPQRDEQGKIVGDFYPLQRAELIALRKNKLINNAAYVHLALRFENPFLDHPIELYPKEFAMRWQMPESSVYEAIGKLKDANVINIKSGKVVLEWSHSQEDTVIDSQEEDDSGNPESLRKPRKNSEIPEKILGSQKKFWDLRKNSEIPEKDIYKERARAQTIQTYSDFIQTLSDSERASFENFVKEEYRKITAKNGEPGRDIISIERFLSKKEDFDNWYERYLRSSAGATTREAIAESGEWQKHPNFEAWIAAIQIDPGRWLREAPTGSEKRERGLFLCWAEENGLVEVFDG